MKFKNIICFLLGHRWDVVALITGEFEDALSGKPIHCPTGYKRKCSRCGKTIAEYFYPRK